ncbi:hypothetical protein [Gracilimonas mengyeensis]|uniref:Uncharacterized protein n=1 Tax=Gracilimonas mengyeensis TaxID=1302730 RepID=A0A521FCN4_9BACT|nr:hypothetical protein [Gracilimonas mengyeensis]SMO93260.1 hypothetical protein SAMN06265219_11658 [Gracilimonas mengyeensis]
MKSRLSVTLTAIALFITAAACTQTESYTSKIHVTKLVPADVFEVLPESAAQTEFKVFKDSGDIKGEYFELAMIEIEETASGDIPAKIMDSLKTEVAALGGNGILILNNEASDAKDLHNKKMKVIAIYNLEQLNDNAPTLVSL